MSRNDLSGVQWRKSSGYDGSIRPHLDGLNRPHPELPDTSVALIWPRL